MLEIIAIVYTGKKEERPLYWELGWLQKRYIARTALFYSVYRGVCAVKNSVYSKCST